MEKVKGQTDFGHMSEREKGREEKNKSFNAPCIRTILVVLWSDFLIVYTFCRTP